jgi:hypothetical protein
MRRKWEPFRNYAVLAILVILSVVLVAYLMFTTR